MAQLFFTKFCLLDLGAHLLPPPSPHTILRHPSPPPPPSEQIPGRPAAAEEPSWWVRGGGGCRCPLPLPPTGPQVIGGAALKHIYSRATRGRPVLHEGGLPGLFRTSVKANRGLPRRNGAEGPITLGGGGGGWHKALGVGSVGLWRRLLASRP